MTKIRARCPHCGDVEFGTENIVVIGTPHAPTGYRFECPSCLEMVRRTAVPDVLELLISAGVRREALEHPAGGSVSKTPLTEADVDSFRSLLRSNDWFESLRASIE